MAEMKWPKGRKKAFLWAAEAFGTPYSERTKQQRNLTKDGFCHTISELTGSTKIYLWASKFRRKVGIEIACWWPWRRSYGHNANCDRERSFFCYLMAALSDKEFDELQA